MEEAELSSANSTAEGGMGSSVAIAGSTVVVGESGAVVTARRRPWRAAGRRLCSPSPAGGWASATQTAELVASNGDENDSSNVYGDTLGSAVAISGETIVASARAPTAGGVGGVLFAGKVYVFLEPAGGWVNSTEYAQLSASDASDPDYLGSALATDGQTVVAGEPDNNGEGDGGPGAIYAFSKPAGGWKSELQTAKLRVPARLPSARRSRCRGRRSWVALLHDHQRQRRRGCALQYTEPPSGGWTMPLLPPPCSHPAAPRTNRWHIRLA